MYQREKWHSAMTRRDNNIWTGTAARKQGQESSSQLVFLRIRSSQYLMIIPFVVVVQQKKAKFDVC